ncbi:MAG: hypothetical protein A3H98_02880 [Bacteroidetes bacterium RIFCSPLOWO2_02_FULL_36_8]|nr:MAG: hypothetical protein A3H98_02880 [Bacteroidetes bacterium RIFCSPLOWO2_02_FULL_36_8]OFY72222.1 MAG: hypothetical protein A3G23_01490 [Bacteroidetes bacterium RIFCSPLOWO2_12_FULL_37_12]
MIRSFRNYYHLKVLILLSVATFVFSCRKEKSLQLSDLQKINPAAVSSNYFTFSGAGETLFTGNKNSFLFVTKTSLTAYEIKKDSIRLELKELSSVSDFMKTRVTTLSDKKLLQLSNAVFVSANHNGDTILAKTGISFYLLFPRTPGNTRHNYYKGLILPEGNLNWEQLLQFSESANNSRRYSGDTSRILAKKDQYTWFWEGPFVDKADEMDNEKAIKAKGTLLTTRHFYERVCYFKNDARYWKDPQFHKSYRLMFDLWYEHRNENLSMEELDEFVLQEMQVISEPVSQKYFLFAHELSQKYGNSQLVFPEKKLEFDVPVTLSKMLKKEKINLLNYALAGPFDKPGWYACGKEVTEPDHFAEPLKILFTDSVKFSQMGFINPDYQLISNQILEGVNGKFYFTYPYGQLLDVAVLGYSTQKFYWGRGFNLSSREMQFLKVHEQP